MGSAVGKGGKGGKGVTEVNNGTQRKDGGLNHHRRHVHHDSRIPGLNVEQMEKAANRLGQGTASALSGITSKLWVVVASMLSMFWPLLSTLPKAIWRILQFMSRYSAIMVMVILTLALGLSVHTLRTMFGSVSVGLGVGVVTVALLSGPFFALLETVRSKLGNGTEHQGILYRRRPSNSTPHKTRWQHPA